MSSNPLRLQILFKKYLNNACTPGESKEFWELMSEYSDNDILSDDLMKLWGDTTVANAADDNINWNDIQGQLQKKIEEQQIPASSKFLNRKPLYWLAIAATLLFFVIAAILFVNTKPAANAPLAKEEVKRIVHQVINLPDGSTVTLNNGSKLDYPPVFNNSTRDVYLTGEAFFDIKHDEKRPFLVHTGNYVTRVLGTAFNIKAYPDDANVAVTVTRGKVQVVQNDIHKTLGILIPGQQLIADKTTHISTIKKSDVSKVLAWKLPDFKFENIALDEAAVRMSNYYGVEVRFKNEAMRNCLFTADFTNYTIEQALDIICTLTNSKWNREGDIIWLDGNGCQQ